MFKRFVLPFLLVMLLAAPAYGQKKTAYTSWDYGDPIPFAWVRLDALLNMDADQIEETIAHEFVHVRQMLLYGSREAWLRAFDRGGMSLRLALEAEAFCASARVGFARGKFPTLDAAVESYAVTLAGAYGFPITHRDAVELIEIYCEVR